MAFGRTDGAPMWRVLRRVVLTALLATGLLGCEQDSWMDQSVAVRMEPTPVTMPILDRLSVIEEPEEVIPGLSQIESEDLIPEVTEYVLGPGDMVTVTIFELITPGVESIQTRRIDELGFIRLPVVGQIKASGLTTKRLEQHIINELHPNILRNPTVTVIVQEGRQKTFNVIGSAGAVGTYTLLKSDFRLIDAIALARGIPVTVDTIYVVRHVPLNDLYEKGFTYDEETAPGEAEPPMIPGANGDAGDAAVVDTAALLEELSQDLDAAVEADAGEVVVEDGDSVPSLDEALEGAGNAGPGRWVNINGEWVMVESRGTVESGDGEVIGEGVPPAEQLVTQRVIEIDAHALMEGQARYNIVVRPGDIINVPAPAQGNVFVGGEIARPGTYALPGKNRLTLRQLILSAGGFGPLAVPERVDLIRRVDKSSEATVRLNTRAIFEGVHPDLFLKPDDQVIIGTNMPAAFAAVARNGFRVSYGFGFLLDRNFGTDVFGAIAQN